MALRRKIIFGNRRTKFLGTVLAYPPTLPYPTVAYRDTWKNTSFWEQKNKVFGNRFYLTLLPYPPYPTVAYCDTWKNKSFWEQKNKVNPPSTKHGASVLSGAL